MNASTVARHRENFRFLNLPLAYLLAGYPHIYGVTRDAGRNYLKK